MFDKCVYLISGRCKYEKATDSDCPATVSGDTAPECTTLMRNNQVCEGDNPLPDGQKGSWIDSADNCGTNDDVYKCLRGELYCYNGFDIRCYLKKYIYMHFRMIILNIFVLATCIINKDCEAEKYCEISTGQCKWRGGEDGSYFALYVL